MNDLGDLELLKKKWHAAVFSCDNRCGMHPLEDLSNIPSILLQERPRS